MKSPVKISDRTAVIACYILAVTALVAAIYHVQLLLPLLKDGKRAEAVVTGINVGAKNSKRAVYQFATETDKQVTARDLFQMYFIRLHEGDHVSVLYDAADSSRVTADLGLWVWQGPAIFLFGFVFLATLGILVLRFKPGKE